MTAILTSSLGGSFKIDGERKPTYLLNENGLIEQIKAIWKENSNVLIVSASPENFERNDNILNCQKEAFPMSGLSINSFEICDYRNEERIQKIKEFDVLMLAGGHVPTQNNFFRKLDLKNRLKDYDGLIIAWSAGTMNCAETVYAIPEYEGEGKDKNYKRFISGLGITERMIIPHFQEVKNDIVDGMRVIEDMAYPDSIGREFIALNNGSFIISCNGVETLYGEAYLIKEGQIAQICSNDEMIQLT